MNAKSVNEDRYCYIIDYIVLFWIEKVVKEAMNDSSIDQSHSWIK